MTAPTLKGFGPSDLIGVDRAARVTFGEALSLNPDALFAYYWPSIAQRLTPIARVVPITADGRVPSVIQGATTLTIDVANKVARTGAELVEALQTAASGNFVAVRSVELLTAAQKTDATKPSGAAARDAASAEQEKRDEANSVTRKISDALGVSVKVAGLIAAAVILLIIFYFLPRRSS